MGKKRKDSISSTVEETAHVSSSNSLKSGKSVLVPCSETKINLKKQKKIQKEKSEENYEDERIVSKQDIKKMTKSIKELSEAVKNLQEILPRKDDLLYQFSWKKEKETPKKKEEDIVKCGFDCEESRGNDFGTIFVKGFGQQQTRDEVKKALTNIFSSCGEVARVFVPIECRTRVPLGFAFIDLLHNEGNDKALELNGRHMGGRELEVKMAKDTPEYHGYTNFRGCGRCITFILPHLLTGASPRYVSGYW